ncbi:MAG: sigma-70 family RNA polymerase sigma factor [Phycisphaerae bacterium]
MQDYATSEIAELAHQLTLSPVRQRLSQLAGIEQMLSLVEPTQSYPYDLVCYHITGYRPRGRAPRPAIAGAKLTNDLVLMAEHISRKAHLTLDQLPQGYRTQEEIADDLSVSTKTIRRWRNRGLMGLRAVFDDGVSRQVFLKSTIDRFCKQHENLVRRGAAFKQLSDQEKQTIVSSARTLLSAKRMRLHEVAKTVSAQTGRAVETVRYTLRRHDEAHPDQALFANGGLPLVSERHLSIWKCHQAGESARQIAPVFDCSVEHVEQVLREMELRLLKDKPPACIYSEEFALPNADAVILGPEPKAGPAGRKVNPPKDLPAYLRSLYDIPLLSAEQERDLFRRYNYLKFRAAQLLESLDEVTVSAQELSSLQRLRAAAEEIKGRIIQANLRLVVSIAKRHISGRANNFFEVVSDGNVSLMRAVENFDYTRGNKFSTYASWAIMKNYARTIPEAHYRYARYVTGQDELLDAAADYRAAPKSDHDGDDLRQMLAAGLAGLTDRERTIVTEHFGLFGRKTPRTLEQLGQGFGVTKERVRQIEKRAMDKLKKALAPAALDLLVE